MLDFIHAGLLRAGVNIGAAGMLARSIAIAMVIALSGVMFLVMKHQVLTALTRLIARTPNQWDDTFVERKVLNRLSRLAPALLIYVMAPLALEGYSRLIALTTNVLLIYMLFISILVSDSFLNAVSDLYRTFEASRHTPIRGFVQVAKIGIYLIGGILVISIIFNKTPLYVLSGLGALSVVLMLIFKDAILGFVAGIQLTANKMIARGDWIEMPQYGADGDVLEVALTTVKVQNWDKTITTIPTYALISDSFKNWRGMEESNGRRIKRAINIDINTIQLCTDEMLDRFSKIQYISTLLANSRDPVIMGEW